VPELFRLDVPHHIADVIRSLPPDLKRSVRAAIDQILTDPSCGEPLRAELSAYWKYRVRRFRIVYAIDKRRRKVRIMAVGYRRDVYEEFAKQLKIRG
jgi:mRNA interferase RelE/StbE